MQVQIHPNIKNYLLKKAEATEDQKLVAILSAEEIQKTDLDNIKTKFGIKNYGIFFSSIVPEDEADLSKFRSDKPASLWVQAQINRVLDSRELHLDLLQSVAEALLDYKEILSRQLKISKKTPAAEAALRVRKLFGEFINTSRIKNATYFFNNLALFIEQHGILVFSTTLNSHESSFSGCAIAKASYPVILVHGASPVRENFTLLHELGHLLYDPSHNDIDFRLQDDLYQSSAEEQWCNSFAANFLLYEDFAADILYDYATIKKIADTYFASIPAIIYHLYNKEIIDGKQKNELLGIHETKKNKAKKSGGKASPYQNLLSNSISNSQLLLHAQQNNMLDKRSLYQNWAGNVYSIPKVFQQLVTRSYLYG